MKLTQEYLRNMVEEALKENNVTGNTGTYQSPKAFSRNASRPYERGVKRPKRPSHTKMFDYL